MLKLNFIFILLLSWSAHATSVKWKDVQFSLSIPEGWREVKDLYGIPVTLLGPSRPPKPRAIIQIIPTDAATVQISSAHARKFGDSYAEGRKAWIKQQNGELLEILPGKFEGRSDSTSLLWAGVSYRINQKTYLDRTYYTNCPKKLFHLKIILNYENRNELPEAESIVRSFSCEG